MNELFLALVCTLVPVVDFAAAFFDHETGLKPAMTMSASYLLYNILHKKKHTHTYSPGGSLPTRTSTSAPSVRATTPGLLPTWPRRLRRRINAPPILRHIIRKLLLDIFHELHGRQMSQSEGPKDHPSVIDRRATRAIIQSNFVAGLHVVTCDDLQLSFIS